MANKQVSLDLIVIDAYKAKIPLPPLGIQKEIVAEIEEERKHVESSKWLIEVNEEKIKDKIAEVWGV